MISTKSAILLLAVLLAAALEVKATCYTLTKEQNQVVLDEHNKLRSKVANGEVPNQPAAANMRMLMWDDRLAEKARSWACSCNGGHDSTEARLVGKYSWVGQNAASRTASGSLEDAMVMMTNAWFDEYVDYTYSSKSCAPGKACGHYTQVAWADSTYVGCGAAMCNGMYSLVCNYASGGNFNNAHDYLAGAVNSMCPGKFGFQKKGLCATKKQCEESGGCTCPLSSGSCQNGGSFDSENCVCNCQTGFYGNKCERTCSNDPRYDSACEQVCTEPSSPNCKAYGSICMRSCGLCKDEEEDEDSQNNKHVLSRVP